MDSYVEVIRSRMKYFKEFTSFGCAKSVKKQSDFWSIYKCPKKIAQTKMVEDRQYIILKKPNIVDIEKA